MTDDTPTSDTTSVPQERRVFENRHPSTDGAGAFDSLSMPVDLLFDQAMNQSRMAVCFADPRQDDMPIIFANNAFEAMTGYSREEVIGQNCRFLQGPESDPETVRQIRECLENETTAVFEVLNYRKDGTPFWNALHIGPIYDETGALRFYYGSQWNITDQVKARERRLRQEILSRELQHRIGNIFAVVLSILRLSGRSEDPATGLAKATDRVRALSRAHDATIARATQPPEAAPAGLQTLIETIVQPYMTDEASRVSLHGPPVQLPSGLIVAVGLSVHELATNAVKYGALGVPDGRVRVAWRRVQDGDGEALQLEWTETGGPPVHAPDMQGSGGKMVVGLLASIDGRIDYEWREDGLLARLTLPFVEDH